MARRTLASDILITVPERLTAVSVGVACRTKNEECEAAEANRDAKEAVASSCGGMPSGAGAIRRSRIPHSALPGLHTFHWRQQEPIDPRMLGLAVSEYVVVEDSWRGGPVRA